MTGSSGDRHDTVSGTSTWSALDGCMTNLAAPRSKCRPGAQAARARPHVDNANLVVWDEKDVKSAWTATKAQLVGIWTLVSRRMSWGPLDGKFGTLAEQSFARQTLT